MAVCRRNHYSLQRRRLESDAEDRPATADAGEPFFFATTKIRIGCGRSSPRRQLQAEPFFFAATKNRIGRGRSLSRQPLQAGPFFFAAMKNRIGRGRLLSRQPLQASHSSLRLRRIESDAKHRCRNNCCRRNHSPLASIRKSELEIKNRCSPRAKTRVILAAIPKLTHEIRNHCNT